MTLQSRESCGDSLIQAADSVPAARTSSCRSGLPASGGTSGSIPLAAVVVPVPRGRREGNQAAREG
jgi:hypothetical protein